MKTLKQAKKITLATLKAFARRNEGKIYAKEVSSFNGMIDGVDKSHDPSWKETKLTNETGYCQTGIQGIYTVGSSRDYFSLYEDEDFEGIEISNCCGVTILAVKKESTTTEIPQANAKLIATAPKLLEALKEMIEALKNITGRDCYDSGHIPCKCSACKAKQAIKLTE